MLNTDLTKLNNPQTHDDTLARKSHFADGEATLSCPRCQQKTPLSGNECLKCGVLLPLALDDSEDSNLRGNLSLMAAWKQVLEHYTDMTLHENFFNLAQQQGKLPHVAWRYGKLLKLMPQDEVAQQMLARVQAMALVIPQKARKNAFVHVRRNWGVHSIAYIVSGFMLGLSMFDPNFDYLRIPGGLLLLLAWVFRIWFISRV